MNQLVRGRTVGVLYAEDFDDPPAVAAPPEAAPAELFDAAQLAAAQQAAHAEGLAAGKAQAAQAQQQLTAAALAAIATALSNADADAAGAGERSADALAGLLLACLRRVLPQLCRLHGVAEARAVARAVLPGLLQEPQITVRAAPATAAAVAAEIGSSDPDLAGRLRLQPVADMTPGDVRIAWADGSAQRDVGALWGAIAAALQPAGLTLPICAFITPDPPDEAPPTHDAAERAPAASRQAPDGPAPEPPPAEPPRAAPPPATPNPQTKELAHAG